MAMSCRNSTHTAENDYTGKMIQAIKSDVIHLEDGQTIQLESDSISKVYYLVRHAEKDTTIQNEPPLTEEGWVRAAKIADILKGTRVDAIYSTMTLRTMYTVDSLADAKAMPILPYENKALKSLIENVRSSEDVNRIFIVGHSNTIPSITNSLMEEEIFNTVFDEKDYGNFIIVAEYKSGSKKVFRLRF
jgi:phosphohistidine phosphatase SixA